MIPEAVELAEEYILNIHKIATTKEYIINSDNTEIMKVNDDIFLIRMEILNYRRL